MKRLLTLCLLMTATFSLIAVASISIGRSQPASKAVQYWHLADCAPPCWAGITPGLTSIEEARERMTRQFSDFDVQPPITGGQSWNRVYLLTGDAHQITIGLSRGLADKINLSAASTRAFLIETMPTLGDLVVLFGSPTCIIVNPNIGFYILYYENPAGQVILSATTNRLSVAEPVDSIAMYFRNDSRCQSARGVAWRGFRIPYLYQADVK